MNRQTAARARGFVTFCVFALMAVAVVAAETGAGRSALPADRADSQLDAPLVVLGFAGLVRRLDASRLVEQAGW